MRGRGNVRGSIVEKIIFKAAFEKLIKDREGEVKITFTVPLSDEQIARTVPIQEPLIIAILYENPTADKEPAEVTGCQDL